MYRYIFDVLPPKCTGTFLTYQNGLNVQYIFGGPPPLRGGDVQTFDEENDPEHWEPLMDATPFFFCSMLLG